VRDIALPSVGSHLDVVGSEREDKGVTVVPRWISLDTYSTFVMIAIYNDLTCLSIENKRLCFMISIYQVRVSVGTSVPLYTRMLNFNIP
jgi:hypothetical protein